MKYTIYINQKAGNAIAPELDVIDYAILDYIIKMFENSSGLKTHTDDSGDKYVWVDYKTLCKSMPLLKINSSSPIQKRITKLILAGYLKKGILNHNMPFIHVTAKAELLKYRSLPDSKECKGCTRFCGACPLFSAFKENLKQDDYV